MPPIDQSQAAAHLAQDALGVCEDHLHPEGRAFAYMLMRDRHVRALFLEEDIDCVKSQILEQRVTLTERSRSLPTGTLPPDDPLHPLDPRSRLAHKIVVKSVVGPISNQNLKGIVNPVPLWKLVLYAKCNGISVYLPDSEHLSNRTPTIMNKRDKYIADRFNQIVAQKLGGSRARCLLLWGQMHFQGGQGDYGPNGRCLADHLNLDYVIVDKSRTFRQNSSQQ